MINDHKTDRSCLCYKEANDLSPEFLDLEKPGTDNLDPDYFPGSLQDFPCASVSLAIPKSTCSFRHTGSVESSIFLFV